MVEHSPFARSEEASEPPSTGEKSCPRCGAETRALTLLTTMTRYYVCSACAFRWNAPREEDRV
jgi:DNA-directed RNA polymerase subunit M/transcription elongation factor TFIIS